MDDPSFQELLLENQRLREENARLRQTIVDFQKRFEELERSAKRQAAPFSKGQPKLNPKKPGRKRGKQHGQHVHRQPPPPAQVNETLEAPLPKQCPDDEPDVETTDGATVPISLQQISRPSTSPFAKRTETRYLVAMNDSLQQNASNELHYGAKQARGASKDHLIAMHLAAGKTVTAAAELCGVHRATVHRKMQDPVFLARVKALRAEQIDRAQSLLVDAAVEAADTLRNLLSAGACKECGLSTSPSAQVAAAKVILDRAGVRKKETSGEDPKDCVEERIRKGAQELYERRLAYERRRAAEEVK